MSDVKTLYVEDIVAWAEQQAEALRVAARTGSNQQLDWENLAEEIEDLGRSYRSSLKSHLRRIIHHLVKLQHSPAVEPRNGWRRTIRVARVQVRDLLDESPSLQREVGRIIQAIAKSAIELAIADLDEHDEIGAVEALVVRRSSYSEEQVLGDWLPDEPRGSGE
ncbi:MAG: DUF29 domain-containing protein [Alphaproteobacteria bacterium]|nr:DUF29 domain-containing protein [Alphaproteobacteria bacterium]